MHPIAFRRTARGLTQQALAAELGVNLSSVQAWERGEGPRPGNLAKLAAALDVDGATLLREIQAWRAEQKSRGPAS